MTVQEVHEIEGEFPEIEGEPHTVKKATNGTNGITTGNPFDFDERTRLDMTAREVRGIKWQGRDYVLKPVNEKGHTIYADAKARALRMADGKLIGIDKIGTLPSLLVSLCLFVVVKRPDGTEAFQPMSQTAIQEKWPPHYVAELYKKAAEISHIDRNENKTLDKEIEELETKLKLLRSERDLVELTAGDRDKQETGEDEVGNLLGATEVTSS